MMIKKILLVALLIVTLTLTGCMGDSFNPIEIDDTPPLEININGTTLEDSRVPTMAKSYFVGIAEGDIVGHEAFVVLAFNGAVATAQEDIWFGSTNYVFPTVAQQMELVSSSIEDDPVKVDLAAGTGIHTVTISYLDENYIERTEDVNLNGTGVVTTVAVNILRVNALRAKTCGTGYAAAGNISIRNLADTPVYRYIQTGYTRCRDGIYTVPDGKSLYINDWYTGVGGLNATNQCRVTLRATYDDLNNAALTAGLFFMPHGEVLMPNFSLDRNLTVPERFHERTDVKISGVADVGSAFVEITIRGWVEVD